MLGVATQIFVIWWVVSYKADMFLHRRAAWKLRESCKSALLLCFIKSRPVQSCGGSGQVGAHFVFRICWIMQCCGCWAEIIRLLLSPHVVAFTSQHCCFFSHVMNVEPFHTWEGELSRLRSPSSDSNKEDTVHHAGSTTGLMLCDWLELALCYRWESYRSVKL